MGIMPVVVFQGVWPLMLSTMIRRYLCDAAYGDTVLVGYSVLPHMISGWLSWTMGNQIVCDLTVVDILEVVYPRIKLRLYVKQGRT